MDQELIRASVKAFSQAVVAGDSDLMAGYLADELRAKNFTVSGWVQDFDVVGIEARGDEVVVRAHCTGNTAKLLETSWTEEPGESRTVEISGPTTMLETYWTEEHGQPRVVAFGIDSAPIPRIPPL
jgi:hypothetical protein